MAGSDAAFVGSIPEHYDRGLGPFIFADPAADMARRVAAVSPRHVLETAAGTGIVTRALRDALPPETELIATDLNPPMLEFAAHKFRNGEPVTLQAADALNLPFADSSFDAVVCQFGVMFFPDKAKGYREAFRVLTPGGRYFFSVWDAHRYNPSGRIAYEVAVRMFQENPPQFLKVPFGYNHIDAVKEAVLDAGFEGFSAEVFRIEKPVGDSSLHAQGYVFGNPMADQIRERGGDPETVRHAVQAAFQAEFGNPGTMTMQGIFFEARKAA